MKNKKIYIDIGNENSMHVLTLTKTAQMYNLII